MNSIYESYNNLMNKFELRRYNTFSLKLDLKRCHESSNIMIKDEVNGLDERY